MGDEFEVSRTFNDYSELIVGDGYIDAENPGFGKKKLSIQKLSSIELRPHHTEGVGIYVVFGAFLVLSLVFRASGVLGEILSAVSMSGMLALFDVLIPFLFLVVVAFLLIALVLRYRYADVILDNGTETLTITTTRSDAASIANSIEQATET